MSKYSKIHGEEKSRYKNTWGHCDYCSGYSLKLSNIQFTESSNLLWVNKFEAEFFKHPFWACNKCLNNLSRISKFTMKPNTALQEEEIDSELLNTGHARNMMVRKIKMLEELFEEIDGIYILPPNEMPEKFRKRTNIGVSFKNLSTLNFFKHIIQNEKDTLLTFWRDGINSPYQHRAKFYTTKITRILLALSKIHTNSELIAIWIWSDTRIVSIEFYCNSPPNLAYIQPTKILRVT